LTRHRVERAAGAGHAPPTQVARVARAAHAPSTPVARAARGALPPSTDVARSARGPSTPVALPGHAARLALTPLLLLVALAGCRATLPVTRTQPPALGENASIAVAASGPYAMELVAGVRARVGARAKVEACVLGCPAVGLYASLSLNPGPHEGRVQRHCQAEVYTGASWVTPEVSRGVLSRTVEEVDGCVDAVARLLLEPRTEVTQVPLDARGPLEPIVTDLREGRVDEARRALEGLVAATPTLAGAWYDLGVLHESRGDPQEARRCYAQARARAPDAFLSSLLSRAP